MTDDDRRLAERLGRYEMRVPVDHDPVIAVRRNRVPWIALGAVAAVLVVAVVVVGGLPFDSRGSGAADPTPVATPSPSPSSGSATPSTSAPVDPSPTPSPQPTAAPEWEVARVVEPSGDPARSANFHGAQWHDGPGWIAFGMQENAEDGMPGIWTSGDGASWALASLPSGIEGSPVLDIARADVPGGSRFAAVLPGHTGLSRILISDDGENWLLATTPETETVLTAVAWGPAGFVATGLSADFDQPVQSGRIWQSADGLEWRELAPADLEFVLPVDIAVIGDRYIAVGFPDGPGPPMTAWVSSDAAAWSQYEVSPPSELGCLCAVADAAAGRIVTLGTGRNTFAALSADGETWDLTPLGDGPPFEVTGTDVIEGGAIVVVGYYPVVDAPQDSLVYVRDADAPEWHAVDWQTELGEASAGLNGRLYVAVGTERTLLLFANGEVVLTADRLP
jgi:hypothetical protein